MTYRVLIEIGKGKNKTVSGSTPLKNRISVINWVKRNPVGNKNTKVRVYNSKTKKYTHARKGSFYSVKRFPN